MSKSRRLGLPRCFVIFDPETGRIIKGMKCPAFRLKQQMRHHPGMKVMRVESLDRIKGARVVDGKFIPGKKVSLSSPFHPDFMEFPFKGSH